MKKKPSTSLDSTAAAKSSANNRQAMQYPRMQSRAHLAQGRQPPLCLEPPAPRT